MKSTLLPFFLFVSFICSAQSKKENIEQFEIYYRKSVEKLRELYGMRGVQFVCDTSEIRGGFMREIEGFLEEYMSQKKVLGVLFYSHEKDSLRIWLYENGNLHYTSLKQTQEQLIQLEFELRHALNVTTMVTKRTVTLRGSEPEPDLKTERLPIAKAIKNSTDVLIPSAIRGPLQKLQHLFIIPEFNISQFPFHLLQPFDNKTYLVDKLSYSFAPHLCNLQVFVKKNEMKVGNKNQLETRFPLIIGNPKFSKSSKYNLPPLPAAGAEADSIASVLKTKAYKNAQASADTILKYVSKTDFLYLATHGYFSFEKILDGSFLAFTPDANHPEGLLTAREIQNTKMKTEMAVLSACQTGFGKVVPGGFIGLARAFYKSGVDFTIMSLWSVDDEKTKELMLLYMEELQKPSYFYPARPLQNAIKRFKENNPNPVYWAPFAVFGFTY